MKKIFGFLSIAIMAMCFVGCAKESPETVAERYLSAMYKGDIKEALTETTLSAEELEKQLPMYEAVWGNMSKWMESYEIKDVEMSDDKESAKVWYSYKYKDGREEKNFVSVKKVDGKWKVD